MLPVEVIRMPRQPSKSARPRRVRRRADTVERAERALERTSGNVDTHTDDPSRDQAETVAGVIKPLKHSD
jgi:hypothetical protein